MSKIGIRPITDADTANIVRWRNSEDVKKNLIQQAPITEESHRQYYERFILTKERYQFIVYVLENGVTTDIGSCFVKSIDPKAKTAEFGIFFGEASARGKGYAKYAISELLQFAFNELKMDTMFLYVLDTNEVAKILYQKIGFEEQDALKDGNYIYMELDKSRFKPILQND